MIHTAQIHSEYLKYAAEVAAVKAKANELYDEFLHGDGKTVWEQAHAKYPKSNNDSEQTSLAVGYIWDEMVMWLRDKKKYSADDFGEITAFLHNSIHAGLT